jgi:hypothetical protein
MMLSNYVVSGSQVVAMTELLASLNLNARDLDDLVVEEKRDEAAVINSEGSDSQIVYLIGKISAEELENKLRGRTPGSTSLDF